MHAGINIYDQNPARNIPKNLNFTINFTPQRLTLSSILIRTELGELLDNAPLTIIERLNFLNPDLHLRYPSFTNRHPIGINNFQILSENVYDFQQNNPHIVFDSDLNVTFTINEQSVRLSTLLRNTNLGQIRRNDPSTIMERLWELNRDLVFHFDFVPGIDFSSFLTSTTLIIPLSHMFHPNSIIFTENLNIIYDCDFSVTFTTLEDISNYKPSNLHTTTTTPSPLAGGSAVLPSTSEQSFNIGTSSRNRNQQSNQSTGSRINQKPKCDILKTQIIDQKLLDIYHTTSTESKNNVRKKLTEIYGQHFTDASWTQFEKIVELHKYGIVFITPNKNEYLLKGLATTTTMSIPPAYKVVKWISSPQATTVVETEEAVPLLEVGEEGAIAIGEEVVEGGASVMIEGGPIGWVVGGVIIVGGIAYLVYNWSHAHNADINSHNQYNKIEKYYIPLDNKTPQYTESSKIKLGISNDMWIKLAEIYQDNKDNYQLFEKKILSEITKFPQLIGTLANSLSDSNLKTLVKVMYNNFSEINIFYMMTNQHGWKIVTNAVGNYLEIEPE